MTSYSSERKATRSGKQQERNCKIIIAGRCGEYDNFLQCGVRVEHQKDGSFLLSQNEFVDELREIQITSQRRKEKDNSLTPQEQTELRGLLGGLAGNVIRQVQHSKRTSTFQNRAGYWSKHD